MLQIRWGITQGSVRYWNKHDHCNIMKTCFIIHNMIIEDEGSINVERWTPPPEETISPPQYTRNRALLAAHIPSHVDGICSKGTNEMLRSDLMDYLWNQFGDEAL